jgi:CRP/FNR family nitrogen fixation transcriptional regulator
MLTQLVSTYEMPHNRKPSIDVGYKFGLAVGRACLVANYSKEEEIHGEDEPTEFVYQVVRGAIRSHTLLSDRGR